MPDLAAGVATADDDVRYVPGHGKDLPFEALAHESRYEWALPHVEGRRVLDFGCGSGFGSARMAEVALGVDGIDYSPSAVAFARRQFGGDNLRFVVGDVTAPEAVDLLSPPYEAIVSFDVIEHVECYLDFVANVAGMLGDDGVALIGCPNRWQTFALNQAWNPHHLQEFTAGQLRGLLELSFGSVTMWTQEMRSPELSARVRRHRGGSTWRGTARRLVPASVKGPLKRLLGAAATGAPFSLADVEFRQEPGDRALRDAFGLVAVCRHPHRDRGVKR